MSNALVQAKADQSQIASVLKPKSQYLKPKPL